MHAVEVLDGSTSGAFDQVVKTADQEHPATHRPGGQVTEVGVDRVFGAGEMIDQTNEPLVAIGLLPDSGDLLLSDPCSWADVDGRQNATIHRSQLGREDDLWPAGGMTGHDLFDFRRVPVAADVVGRQAFVALREMSHEFGGATGTTHPAFRIDNDVVWFDNPRFEQWCQRQDGSRCVAAWVGDQVGLRDGVAKEFGQAVDRLAEPRWVDMGLAVPVVVGGGIIKAVVGTQIDHPGAGCQQVGHNGGTRAVRQATEDNISPLANFGRAEIFQRQIEPADEAGVDTRNGWVACLAAGHRHDFNLGVSQQVFD